MKVNTVDIFTVFSFSTHENDILFGVLVNGEQTVVSPTGNVCPTAFANFCAVNTITGQFQATIVDYWTQTLEEITKICCYEKLGTNQWI